MFYFAYASNMDPRQISRRCPSYRFYSIATLNHYTLSFSVRSRRRKCGAATIVQKQGDQVLGIVYIIKNKRDWINLDKAEGFNPQKSRGNVYIRLCHTVVSPDRVKGKIPAIMYISEKTNVDLTPSRAYLDQIIFGAKYWDLPKTYVKKLYQSL